MVLIFRYLAKEVFITLASLTGLLLLIFMSNQLVIYLNRAANGQIPGMFILQLMLFEMPTLLSLLLPFGFYLALMVAYGRLYADSEMVVLQACGYGPVQLMKHSIIMASWVALVVLVMMLWVSPMGAKERTKLLQTSGVQMIIKTIIPARFNAIPGGRENVFYVESMDQNHTVGKHVFVAREIRQEGSTRWDVLAAEKAWITTDRDTQEDYAILERGGAYQGVPGHADYRVAEFQRYKARLPHPIIVDNKDIRTVPTSVLWAEHPMSAKSAAELQWRLSIPLMAFVLMLVAVPLSRVNPRSGKFAKLLPAIIIYILYANLLFAARHWLQTGALPSWLGMWWLHLLVAMIGGLLMWRNQVKLA